MIKRNKCKVTGCNRFVFSDKLCLGHQHLSEKKQQRDQRKKDREKEKPIHYSSFVNKEAANIADLIKIADREFSIYIRRQYGDITQCFTCGATATWKSLECGHFIKRDQDATRFLETNCEPQCNFCNCGKDGNIKVFRERLVGKHGEKVIEEMEQKARQVKHWTRDELLELIQFYRNLNKKFDQ